jgi:hypothetical protein
MSRENNLLKENIRTDSSKLEKMDKLIEGFQELHDSYEELKRAHIPKVIKCS